MDQTDRPTLLITGAGGWLGLNLLQQLAANPSAGRVRCLLLSGQGAELASRILPKAEIVYGDIRNYADCERFVQGASGAMLIHTAGLIHPGAIRELYDVNLAGTQNLLSAAIKAGVKRAVVLSSNSPLGCNPHPDHCFDEESPYNPYMNYGRSKMQMELYVKEVQCTGHLETVIIRAPWFYGPYQPARQTLFFRMIRDGSAPIVGSGRNLRSMANTQNLAQGLLLAAQTQHANGKIYWMADARPYSMIEIIDTIERLLEEEFHQKCTHKRMKLPGIASEVAFCVDKVLQSVGVYHQKIHVLSEMNKTIACTTAKAERELGYRPAPNLEDGMRKSIQMCISEL